MPKRRLVAVAFAILGCSLCSFASDRTEFANLPPEAQASISAALKRDLGARYPAAIEHFTLTAADGVNRADFGNSVAIDGNTVVVGAFNNDQDLGVAYVFVKPASGWTDMTQTAELTASDGQSATYFGSSVSISGNTIVVGADEANVNGNPAQGAAYVFVEPSSGWTNMTETAKLTASDGVTYSGFGSAVGINGNTVVVGAEFGVNGNVGPGTAYVFVMPSSGWTDMTQTAELTASDGSNEDYFGTSVSIDGNVVVVGSGLGGSKGSGAAYVFVEPPTGWVNATETAELTASDGAVGDGFGQSVTVSGNTVAVGAAGRDDEKNGTVYVFVKPANGWANKTQTAELTISDGMATCFGNSVSISGNVIVGGAQCTNYFKGAAFVFVKPNNGWHNTSNYKVKLSIPFSLQTDYFGGSVAISGTTGIIGAPYAPTSLPCPGGQCQAGPGEAFIFTEK